MKNCRAFIYNAHSHAQLYSQRRIVDNEELRLAIETYILTIRNKTRQQLNINIA